MANLIEGNLLGVYQEDGSFFARFSSKNGDIDIPIDSEQFHSLKLDKGVKLIVEIVV